MAYDISVFDRIKFSGAGLRLQPLKTGLPLNPGRTYNLLRQIVDLARFMGLREIPARTIQMMREDPFYRYCFLPVENCHLYRASDPNDQLLIDSLKGFYDDPIAKKTRQRLKELLLQPDSYNDRDLWQGLGFYLNNFPLYFPDGFYREPSLIGLTRPKCEAVDQAMRDLGITAEKIDSLRTAAKAEEKEGLNYSRGVEFLKLSLRIFNVLVEKYHYVHSDFTR